MIIKGSCVMYTALKKVTWESDEYELPAYVGDYYIQEPIEIIKNRLSNGLESLGLRCLDITIRWFDKYGQGNSCIDFECESNENKKIERDMYIRGIKTFEWQQEADSLLEVYFTNIDF
jgi:hypothetical protein